MSPELEILKLVAGRLEAARFDYMVSGSVALACYGQPRMTRDIDIVIELAPADADRLAALFQPDFYCDVEDARDAARRHSLFNLVHFEEAVKVDLIVRKDSDYRRGEFLRRRRLPIDGFEVWVVAAEDLVLSKLFWARDSHSEMQLRDVRSLLSSIAGLDEGYLARWAKELGVEHLLAEVRP
jgi:hypothetical protein